ncbi:MAG: hypothetical protein NXI04_10455 [Planctomycetaceae bacterium]|nr:hypothetical protein [Planctomycetaceae bacterium]
MSNPTAEQTNEPEGGSWLSLVISSVLLLLCVVFGWLHHTSDGNQWALSYLLMKVCVISVAIWQVCDPFADAAQWVGQKFHLPGSVRGATLDAIASSMPELFSGIFFVVLAIAAVKSGSDPGTSVVEAGAEGFGSTIATCAGSAVYNMILIPAFCALVISWSRPERPTIDVEDEVISRDGVWFLCTQFLLILFLFQSQMMWWMGVVFLAIYAVYIFQLYYDAVVYRKRMAAMNDYFTQHGADLPVRDIMSAMKEQSIRVSAALVMKAQESFADGTDEDEEEQADSAGMFFGFIDVPLNGVSTVMVLTVSTLLAAAACYFLVEATIETAELLDVPAFFVAVILAAAASSVPDTFLAIAAARRGDDSGAVSNAFGSNIFDICICLSIPLLINSWLTGWEPVSLLQDGKPMEGLVGLRILLAVLTIVNLGIMWHNRQITRRKAWIMCGLYVVFVAYAVLGSLGIATF